MLGQRGDVGRAEGTEKWSVEGRNAILITRTQGRGQRRVQRAGGGQGGAWSRQNQQLEPEPGAG